MSSMTQQELKQLLHYNPETGHFTWLASGPSAMNPTRGKRAGAARGGTKNPTSRRINIRGYTYGEAKLAWLYMTGEWPVCIVDHRDRNQANNKWSNLRLASEQENARNRSLSSANTSGVVGVSWVTRERKYQAEIMVSGEKIFLGYFTDLGKAATVRRAAELRYFREFAPHD